ncbi:hypothetical protein OG474_29500 [Kribbella sp. NBC_01505]|uniref:helix-turn-helix domain-containing protein n=1 Tax=Kribbella sp. NBC_01505 TaxID=2903580 RepID=UPI003868F69C
MADGGRKPNELLRKARGSMSQEALAEQVNLAIYRATGHTADIEAKVISAYERGWHTWPRDEVRSALCEVLQVRTSEELGFYINRPKRRLSEPASVDLLALAGKRSTSGVPECLVVPAGRSYFGTEISAYYQNVDRHSSNQLLIRPDEQVLAQLSKPDRRSMVFAVDSEHRHYVADGRRVGDRARGGAELQAVPLANVVDDLTVGIIWATANADSALLADDAQLERSQLYVMAQQEREASQGAVDEVPSLNRVAALWLGSQFCSRYIVRHLDQVGDDPLFWTREQRGEDAAAWLLWAHKFEYLRHVWRRFPRARRGFCIPESEVEASPGYERVMLLLAMALMEAFGIHVQISGESDHAEVEGFVLADQAIVASWLDSPGLWCVEASASGSRLATYRELADQVGGESLLTQTTPLERLAAAADYLRVPWGWFRRRCAELAAVGVDDICHPRSRLLSTRGLNTAVSYVAHIDVLEGDDFARR